MAVLSHFLVFSSFADNISTLADFHTMSALVTIPGPSSTLQIINQGPANTLANPTGASVNSYVVIRKVN